MLLNELPPETTLDFTDDERWLTTQRIIDSQHFCKSPRLSRLLLFLAEQTLLDRTDLLTEPNIAIMVFDRDANFNPGVDTIVRSHMVRLRQKLDQYAVENQMTSSLRLAVPKGEYLVRFERAMPSLSESYASLRTEANVLPPRVERPIPLIQSQPNPLAPMCWLLGAAILILVAALLIVLNRPVRKATDAPVITHPLWSRLFQSHRRTTFIAADSGLVLLHRMTKKETTLAEYLKRDFSQELRGLSPERTSEVLNMADRRYTSFVDLNIYRRLQHLPFMTADKLEVKYARDIQMDELKQGNIILSGARGANPWLELYEPELNFLGKNDAVHHAYSFVNRHPEAGETPVFSVSESDPKQHVLGVLAFLPNLDGDGNALIVEGNSMAGTEAISDFLFDDDALVPFLSKIRKPDGTVPHFEVLIESHSVNGSAGPFHILAYRTHP